MKKPAKAAAARPSACAALLQRAAALQAAGQGNAAAQLLTQAVNEFPAEPEPWLRLGNLLAGAGQWSSAERCYAARCKLKPAAAQPHYNWGVALTELRRVPEAITAYARAVALQPDYAAAHHALALAHVSQNNADAALAALDRAIALKPDVADYRIERARACIRLGQWVSALADLDTVPAAAEALNLKGIALKHLHRPAEALAAYDRALQRRPDFAEALNNRGNLRLLMRRFTPALQDFDQAFAVKPDSDWLAGLRLYTAMHIYEWSGAAERLAALLQAVAQGRQVVQPLALQCLVDDPAAQQQAARIWAQHSFPPKAAWAPGVGVSPSRKIRLAYVSRDFRAHPVSFLMAEVFELHDRERFEVIALNYGAASDDDAMQQRLRAGFDRFLDVGRLADAQIAELARSLGVDIAVDLTGMTDGARNSIFAWRAAPVQVLSLGTLGTSGSPVYDYLLADDTLVPAATRAACDEKLIYLPSYQPNDRRRPRPELRATRAELGLPERGFVYCCFNNPCKISPAQFAAWAEILKAVPCAVLWVLDEDDQAIVNLRGHAQAAGLDPQRIVFARRTGRESYLASLQAADLFLDTLPYNAGTTASDALWMGLPVLTQAGHAFAARMAASLLRAVGLPELVTTSAADYVQTAVRLARQPDLLTAIRARLSAARTDSELFDTPRFTRNLERAFCQAHARRIAGLAPADIVVEDASGR